MLTLTALIHAIVVQFGGRFIEVIRIKKKPNQCQKYMRRTETIFLSKRRHRGREGEFVDREEYRVSRSADITRLTDPATDLLAPAPRHRYQGNMEKVAATRWDIYARYEEAAKQGEPVFISAEVCVYTLTGRTLPQHNYDRTERAFTRLWNRGIKKSTANGITKFGAGIFFNDISMFLVAFE